MKIVGALCWFEESPEFLERLVRSLPGVVDELVALDGPWQHFRHGGTASPADQQEALRETAAEVGLPLQALGGDELYGSQVAKRSLLYGLCAERGDWMLVVDGDEEIAHCEGLREALAATELDCARANILNISSRRWPERGARRVFRTCHGLSVMEAHNGIVTDDGRWLAGPRRISPEPALDLLDKLHIRHYHMARGAVRDGWSMSYYKARARQRIEVH